MKYFLDRNIKDIYLDIFSYDFLKRVFVKPSVVEKDLQKGCITFTTELGKGILDRFNNDIIKMVQALCIADKCVFRLDMQTSVLADKFYATYTITIDNYSDFIFIPMLQDLRAIFVLECKECQDMTSISVIYSNIDRHLQINEGFFQNIALDNGYNNCNKYKLSYDDVKKIYNKNKEKFFSSDYDMSKDILINFLNMIVTNCIKYELEKNICMYYDKKGVGVYSSDKVV